MSLVRPFDEQCAPSAALISTRGVWWYCGLCNSWLVCHGAITACRLSLASFTGLSHDKLSALLLRCVGMLLLEHSRTHRAQLRHSELICLSIDIAAAYVTPKEREPVTGAPIGAALYTSQWSHWRAILTLHSDTSFHRDDIGLFSVPFGCSRTPLPPLLTHPLSQHF